ncbi:MAG: universal stress protein [bacterium]|nr:universal stress protein [bacterium]
MNLLVLSTLRQSKATVKQALDLAEQDKTKLIILFVVDDVITNEAISDIKQNSFLDRAASQVVAKVLADEYIERGDRMLLEIAELAEQRGVASEKILKTGSLITEVKKITQEKDINRIIITKRDRSKFSRLLFGSPLQELQESLDIPIDIIEE